MNFEAQFICINKSVLTRLGKIDFAASGSYMMLLRLDSKGLS